MKANILLIEDEKPLSNALKIALEKNNYNITVVDNGKDALAAIENIRPDLVLLDIVLPELSGWDIMVAVKKNPKISKTKIIVFSNLDSPARLAEFKRYGAIDYLVKSTTTLNEICHRVELVLGSAETVSTLLQSKHQKDTDNTTLNEISKNQKPTNLA